MASYYARRSGLVSRHSTTDRKFVVEITDEEREFLLDASSWSDFANSLYGFAINRGGLTPKQANAMRSMKAKVEARKAAKDEAARQTEADVVEGFDALYAGVFKAVEGGMKHPTLRLGSLTLSWARRPRNPENKDHVYVKFQGVYVGKLNSKGEFFPYRLEKESSDRENCLADMSDACKNFLMRLLAYGKETGNCGVCGRVLTDENSIEKGIGPVCEKRVI